MLKRSSHATTAAALLLFTAIGACTGSVETTPPPGSGGSTASSGSATAAVSSGAGGGALCGGAGNPSCGEGMYCAYKDPGSCGKYDGYGTCQPRPNGCNKDCTGVCGCDGNFYCNACLASAAGFDFDANNSTCWPDAGSPAIYSAEDLFTNVPRFAVFKADPIRDICVRLVFEGALGGEPNLGIKTPMGWNIETAEVTDHASDCHLDNGGFKPPPLGAAVQAKSGSGKIDFSTSFPQCDITMHASLSFPPGAPWVPANEPLDVEMLHVKGACPP